MTRIFTASSQASFFSIMPKSVASAEKTQNTYTSVEITKEVIDSVLVLISLKTVLMSPANEILERKSAAPKNKIIAIVKDLKFFCVLVLFVMVLFLLLCVDKCLLISSFCLCLLFLNEGFVLLLINSYFVSF